MDMTRRKIFKHLMGLPLTAAPHKNLWALLASSKATGVAQHPVNAELRKNLLRIDQVMRSQGIQHDSNTGRAYFSGYSYKTLYDWDPYFEGIVQLELGWYPEYMVNGVKIFLDIQRADGFIRRVNDPSAREEADEMLKPFLAQISVLVSRRLGTTDWLDDNYYQRMRKYVLYWLSALSKDNGALSYWRSAPHTGMDTQHERAGHWKADYDNGVDLNSYLYRECLAFALIADAKGKKSDAHVFRAQAETKKTAIQTHCWNEKDGFYYDVDNRSGHQIPVKSIAGFAPLWARIATPKQAERLVQNHLTNSVEFWRAFPVSALAATEKGYTESYLPDDVHGSLWRANTWIPTNYYIFHGLRSYGYNDIATRLADITYRMVVKNGDREYYSSDSAAGCGLDPFWGWSLLAYFMPWENENDLDPTALTLREPIASAL
jgi:hypothetical protein